MTLPQPRPLARLVCRLAWWALGSVAGMHVAWGVTTASWGGARWNTLLAPFTISQPDFFVLTALPLVAWIGSLWGPPVVRALVAPLGAGMYAFWALVVDGIGV